MLISDLSVKNPVFAWMVMAGVALFGTIAYFSLGISQMPDVDNPTLSISASWEGASPEIIEKEVTDVIEEAVLGVEGVDEMTSTSSRGNCRVNIQFDINVNIDVALQEVQARLARAQHDMPQDVELPTINKSNPEDMPILWLSLAADMPQRQLMEYARDYIKEKFSSVKGVSEIMLGGYVEPAVRVWVSPSKMKALEITPEDVVSSIQQGHKEYPAGYVDDGKKEINIRVYGEAGGIEEIRNLILTRKGSSMWKALKIKDVAEVEDGLEDVRNISRSQNKATIGIGIRKQRGVNAVEVAKLVKKKAAAISKNFPKGMELGVRFDTTKFIEESSNEMLFIIILSILLTSLVCWLFLGSLRASSSVLLTIPMSVLGTFFIMRLFNFTLNTFTLLALTLVIGIVVDDAIMVIENITRHAENGESRVRAALRGSREIAFAAMAATVAILAIFIPVIFMEGVIGRYFFQFGITISAAVAISLLGALTVTPMMASQFMKQGGESKGKYFEEKFMVPWTKTYASFLAKCLKNRWKVVISAMVLFMVSLVIGGFVKREFVPQQDQGRLNINIQMAPGVSLEATDEMMKKAEAIVAAMPETLEYFSRISGNSGGMFLTLKDKKIRPRNPEKKRKLKQPEIMQYIRAELKKIPGVRNVNVQDMSFSGLGGGRSRPVEIIIKGKDWDTLAALGTKVADEFEKTGKMADAESNYKPGLTELQIIPDRKKAYERGVAITSIGAAVNAFYGGVRAAKYTSGGKRYDIIVQLRPEERKNIAIMKDILIRNSRGELIKLGSLAEFKEQPALLSITRQDRQRAIRVSANLAPGASQGEAMDAASKVAKGLMPDGYAFEFSGASKSFKEGFGGLWIALILGIIVAYMILGVQFNSFAHPVSVLMALPFSVTGALIALALTGNTLNMYSMIGLILLMGIVKKNSIILVDFTNKQREAGLSLEKALMKACPIRLRPILMTSVSTIAAAVPPLLSIGPGNETRVPMAVVVIGGVLVSTLLTLFVVPCVYSLMSPLESRKHIEEANEAIKELGQEHK